MCGHHDENSAFQVLYLSSSIKGKVGIIVSETFGRLRVFSQSSSVENSHLGTKNLQRSGAKLRRIRLSVGKSWFVFCGLLSAIDLD
jgi:hypothetical protein